MSFALIVLIVDCFSQHASVLAKPPDLGSTVLQQFYVLFLAFFQVWSGHVTRASFDWIFLDTLKIGLVA